MSQAITVKPSYGLTDEEIEQMLLDSFEHAEEDIQRRLLREQRVEAERILHDARSSSASTPTCSRPTSARGIEAAMARVAELALGRPTRRR